MKNIRDEFDEVVPAADTQDTEDWSYLCPICYERLGKLYEEGEDFTVSEGQGWCVAKECPTTSEEAGDYGDAEYYIDFLKP